MLNITLICIGRADVTRRLRGRRGIIHIVGTCTYVEHAGMFGYVPEGPPDMHTNRSISHSPYCVNDISLSRVFSDQKINQIQR